MKPQVRRALRDALGYPGPAYDAVRKLPLIICGHSMGGATAQVLHGLLQLGDPTQGLS